MPNSLRSLRVGFATLALSSLALLGGCSKDDEFGSARNAIPPDAQIEDEKAIAPSPSVHIAAGDLAVGQNKIPEAIEQYEIALKEQPTNDDALFKLATLHTYGRSFDKAISLWERYAKATDDSASGWSNLGRCHELAGHWREAEVSYLEALKRDPKNKAARVNYGILLAKRERSDEAETQLTKVLVPAEVQYNLGSVCELRRDYVGARQRYEKALSFDPGLTAARQRLETIREVTSAAN